MSFHVKTSHEVLKWARESLGYSRNRAADEIGITIPRLNHLEAGTRNPSMDEIKLMSKAYKRTIATLLLSKPPMEKPMPKDCRTVNSLQLNHFHEKTILAVRKARGLLRSLLELKEEMGLVTPQFPIRASMSDNPTAIATRCRELLKLSEVSEIESHTEALDNYIDRVEALGVAVFQLSLTQDHLRGFSITDESAPIIVIKRGGELPTTKVFTLFHELAHVILNQGGLCDISLSIDSPEIEKWCNAFAAELLAPSQLILGHPIVLQHRSSRSTDWMKKDLIEIGRPLHVSALVILRRLLTLNLTTKEVYSEKHKTWNNPSFGRAKHPGRNVIREAIAERGKNFMHLAFKAFEQNRISMKDLSDFIGVGFSQIDKTRRLASM